MQQQMMIRNNVITNVLRQIAVYQPLFNFITSINPDLFNNDNHHHQSNNRLLENVPVLIKDSILTNDWISTSASREILQYYVQHGDQLKSISNAPVIQQLINSGALVIGKTTCPELCADIQTFSDMYGVTRNPYDVSLTSGGSSGGSAAAVRLGVVPLAIGSDMAGSLRIPSAFCGVYSLRPTVLDTTGPEYVDYRGHVPPAPMSTHEKVNELYNCPVSVIGPIGNNIDILKKFVSATTNQKMMKKTGTIKIGITTEFPGVEFDYRIKEAINNQFVKVLSKHPDIKCDKIKDNLNYQQLRTAYVELTQPLTNAINTLYGTDIVPPNPDSVTLVQKYISEQQKVLKRLLDEYDCWVIPVTPVLPFAHNPTKQPIEYEVEPGKKKTMSYWKSIALCTPVTVLGVPVVTLPFGMIQYNNSSVPVAVQVIGRWKNEQELLSVCERLEAILSHQVHPPKLELNSRL
jgi:amidase